MKNIKDFKAIFGQLEDPRSHINRLHKLEDILLIGIISVICAGESWKDMELYAKAKEDFLKTFLELPNGIPSDDTFRRVFSSIDSQAFEACFVEWVSHLADFTKGQVIAIDGKTIRGAKTKQGEKSPVHMVSAWASDNNLVLGQVRVDQKSNEITAIPKLLDILLVDDAIITIDAMGCQEAIAAKIIENRADYILAVKENQKQLYQDIEDEFRFGKNIALDTTQGLNGGRIETRKCSIITDFKFINPNNKWTQLKTIIKIESHRAFKNSTRPEESATRYYIASFESDAEMFQKAIRSHWGIENKLHWVLDVAFSEDASRKRNDNAAQNFSILNKIALNLIKNEPTKRMGVKRKRLKAAWNQDFLTKILNLKV